MALTMSAVSPTGAAGDYWHIIHCSLDAANRVARVATALYLDQNARETDRDPLMIRQDAFDYTLFIDVDNAIRVGYLELKKLPEFATAVDA